MNFRSVLVLWLKLSENTFLEDFLGSKQRKFACSAERRIPISLLRRKFCVFSVQRKNPQEYNDTFCSSVSATEKEFSSKWLLWQPDVSAANTSRCCPTPLADRQGEVGPQPRLQ